jgi:hypothetical protein
VYSRANEVIQDRLPAGKVTADGQNLEENAAVYLHQDADQDG